MVLSAINIQKLLKTMKYHAFSKKAWFLSINCSKYGKKDEKIFKGEESIDVLKIIDLIIDIEEYQ